MGRLKLGDGSGPQSGIQVLPVDREGQKAARDRRIAVEEDGRGCGSHHVAGRREELI